ncbi:Mitochondrial transcription termination factor family protein [Euphorbia peplus]|nr:Mitochondrial transcription termination factor family protein [Euphorbia peplus]
MLHWLCRIRSSNTSLCLHKFPIFPPLSNASFSTTSTPKISIFDYLVNNHNFSPECASKVSSLSSTNYLKKPRKADLVLNFLKENGFAQNHLETLVQKAPWILSANLNTSVKPKIKLFQDLGFQSTDLADFASAYPFLLRRRADRLRLSVLSLKNVLGPNADICRILKKSSVARGLASSRFNTTLVPNVEYLKSFGICPLQIARHIPLHSVGFVTNPDKFKDIVKRVDEMGVDTKSNMFLYAVRVLSSMTRKNWELKLKLFRDLGFSEQNISHAFVVSPQAFAVSERKIKEITQLLLNVVEFSISDIVCNIVLLTYSVETRFKPRVRVLKALEKKNLLKKKPSLPHFFRMSNADFRNKYVIPYIEDELGDLSGSEAS